MLSVNHSHQIRARHRLVVTTEHLLMDAELQGDRPSDAVMLLREPQRNRIPIAEHGTRKTTEVQLVRGNGLDDDRRHSRVDPETLLLLRRRSTSVANRRRLSLEDLDVLTIPSTRKLTSRSKHEPEMTRSRRDGAITTNEEHLAMHGLAVHTNRIKELSADPLLHFHLEAMASTQLSNGQKHREIPSSRVDNDAEASRSHTTRVFARGAGQSQAPAIGQWRADSRGGKNPEQDIFHHPRRRTRRGESVLMPRSSASPAPNPVRCFTLEKRQNNHLQRGSLRVAVAVV